MATIENDLSRLSDGEIRKRIEQARRSATRSSRPMSREIVRDGEGGRDLARLECAGDDFKAAKAELARRAGAKDDPSGPLRRSSPAASADE